jgi:hypothetical protein
LPFILRLLSGTLDNGQFDDLFAPWPVLPVQGGEGAGRETEWLPAVDWKIPAKNDLMPASQSSTTDFFLDSPRDIMRKDKGLNGGFDRLPMPTWIMFLKFLECPEL